MLPMRDSGADGSNGAVQEESALPEELNLQWLARARDVGLGVPGDLLLIGGSSVVHSRIRIAQSHARHDLTPSSWSLIGVMVDGGDMLTVRLDTGPDLDVIIRANAIATVPVETFGSPVDYPNIAVIRFPADPAAVLTHVNDLRTQRSIVDLPALVVAWLGFVWGVSGAPNPLLEGHGLPSAALVETAFGMADVELTPGLASASSCPEAIWQAAKWWHQFYADTEGTPAQSEVPTGRYLVRKPEILFVAPA